MRSRNRALAAIAAAALAVGVAACGSDDGGDASDVGDAPKAKTRIAMVFPGPINDKGFNESAYQGLKRCEQVGAEISYVEKVPVPSYVRTFQEVAQKNDVVMAPGFEFGEIAAKVAPQFGDVKFVVTQNPLPPESDNVLHLMPNSTQGAYLAGVAAGKATKSGKLGGVGGFDFPVLQTQMKAFEAGAKSVNPDATMKVVYLGTFDDVAKGKEAAQSMASAGIDVIYHIADAAGLGVISGAKAAGIKVVGWGFDQNELAPETVIASQLVDQAKMVADECQSIIDGKFEGGKVAVDGLRSKVIELTKVYNEPAGAQEAVDAARQQILDGAADVPSVGGDIPGAGPQSG